MKVFMRFIIVFFSLGRLLTKEDLPKNEPSGYASYRYFTDEEGDGMELIAKNHSFVFKAKPIQKGQKPTKTPVRETGFKGGGCYRFKHEITSDKHLVLGLKTTYGQNAKKDLSKDILNQKKEVSLLGTVGYELKLRDGNTFQVFLDTGVELNARTINPNRGIQDSKDPFTDRSQKGLGASVSITKTF